MKTKCQTCYYGAIQEGFRGTLYDFRTASKKVNNKVVTIDYSNGELGCRKFEDNERQEECLNNNFSEYRKF